MEQAYLHTLNTLRHVGEELLREKNKELVRRENLKPACKGICVQAARKHHLVSLVHAHLHAGLILATAATHLQKHVKVCWAARVHEQPDILGFEGARAVCVLDEAVRCLFPPLCCATGDRQRKRNHAPAKLGRHAGGVCNTYEAALAAVVLKVAVCALWRGTQEQDEFDAGQHVVHAANLVLVHRNVAATPDQQRMNEKKIIRGERGGKWGQGHV